MTTTIIKSPARAGALLSGLALAFHSGCLETEVRRPLDILDPDLGSLVITEIFGAGADPLQVSWLEIENRSDDKRDLAAIEFRSFDGVSWRSATIDADWEPLEPGARAVFASGPVEAWPAAYDFGADFGLGSTQGHIVLDVAGAIVDEVEYGGTNEWLTRAQRGLSLDPATTDPTANDLGANWCLMPRIDGATTMAGTPGAPNPACEQCKGTSRVHGSDDWLFDDQVIHDIDFQLADAALQTLNADPLSRTYVPATLRIGEHQFENAAISYKGQSTLRNCFDTAGNRICDKLSIRIRFDEFDDCGRFLGLRRLKLHGYQQDPTALHERISYWLFRAMNIPASRATHAFVTMNGQTLGLYGLVEAVDQEFLERHFDDGEGTLYKEAWPGWGSRAQFEERLAGGRRHADLDAITALSDHIAATPYDLPADIESLIDVNGVIRSLAVDRAIGNDDGPTRFYCWPDKPCENHNYYWYQPASNVPLVYIPWDLDGTLWSVNENLGPEYWDSPPRPCVPTPLCETEAMDPCPDWAAAVNVLPGECNHLMNLQDSDLRARYLAAATEFVNGPLLEAESSRIDAICQQVAQQVPRDPFMDLDEFLAGCDYVLDVVREQRSVLSSMLANAR